MDAKASRTADQNSRAAGTAHENARTTNADTYDYANALNYLDAECYSDIYRHKHTDNDCDTVRDADCHLDSVSDYDEHARTGCGAGNSL